MSRHASVRITNTDPNARHREGGNGCFGLVIAPALALVLTALIRKRTR